MSNLPASIDFSTESNLYIHTLFFRSLQKNMKDGCACKAHYCYHRLFYKFSLLYASVVFLTSEGDSGGMAANSFIRKVSGR